MTVGPCCRGVVGGSYAARLSVALALTILVMVVVGGIVSAQAPSATEADVEGDLTTIPESQADGVDEWVRGTERSVRVASDHPTASGGDVDEVGAYVGSLVEDDELTENVVAVHSVDTATWTVEASSDGRFVDVSFGAGGAMIAGAAKWILVALGSATFAGVVHYLVGEFYRAARTRDDETESLYRKIRAFVLASWVLYPLVWALSPNGLGLMTVGTTAVVVTYIDVVAKAGFGLIALHGLVVRTDRTDPAGDREWAGTAVTDDR